MKGEPVRRSRLRGLLVVGLVALVAGCALAFQRPEVSVARVTLTGLSFTGGEVEVLLRLENPNRYALESRAFRYALSFAHPGPEGDTAWTVVVDEESRDTVRVPARDTARVPVRVPFDLAAVGAAAGRLLREGELGYRFNGALRLQTPVGEVEVPFDERGAFRP